jgi:hypothetical protein
MRRTFVVVTIVLGLLLWAVALDVECLHPSGGGCFVWSKVKLKNG